MNIISAGWNAGTAELRDPLPRVPSKRRLSGITGRAFREKTASASSGFTLRKSAAEADIIKREHFEFMTQSLFSQLETEAMIEGLEIHKAYLTLQRQRELLAACRRICKTDPLWTPLFKGKDFVQKFSLQNTNCGIYGWLGDESGFRYSLTNREGRSWQPIPREILAVVKEVAPPAFRAENCLINFYRGKNHLGLHRDQTERNRRAPIISISLGQSCVFQIGGLKREDKIHEIVLDSGDVVVMGGGLRGARNAYHGVKALLPGTCPEGLMKTEARINITVRQVD